MDLSNEEKSVFLGADFDALLTFVSENSHCVIVDWREDDTDVVSLIGDCLENEEISADWDDTGEKIVINYDNQVTTIDATSDRYVCIRAVKNMIADKYEIRVFEDSYKSDTHWLYIKPIEWWQNFDGKYAQRSKELFLRIDELTKFP